MNELKAVKFDAEFDEDGYIKDLDPSNEFSLTKLRQKKTTFMTEVDKTQHVTKNSIHTIEKAEIPDIYSGDSTKMPDNVEFKRVINNILNAMNFLNVHDYEEREGNFSDLLNSRQDSNENWRRYLMSPENEKVFSDAFWYCILKFFKEEPKRDTKFPNILDSPQKRGFDPLRTEESGVSMRPMDTGMSFKEAILARTREMINADGSVSKLGRSSPGFKVPTSRGGISPSKTNMDKKMTRSTFSRKDQDDSFEEEKFSKERNFLLNRISKNYVDLFLSVEQEHKPIFFERYFDILSQGVFYSYFYAYPKSRPDFNDEVKRKIILEFSTLFTGIKISNPHKYYSLWCLDLGAGNVLKTESRLPKIDAKEVENFPLLSVQNINPKKSKRVRVNLQYSETISKYLKSQNYKTRSLVKNFWMRFSQIEENQDDLEQKFAIYMEMVKKIEENKKRVEEENRTANENREKDLLRLKNECYRHQKRLQKRKMEELEKGAHEYANYLVSMLNAANTNNNQGKNHI